MRYIDVNASYSVHSLLEVVSGCRKCMFGDFFRNREFNAYSLSAYSVCIVAAMYADRSLLLYV